MKYIYFLFNNSDQSNQDVNGPTIRLVKKLKIFKTENNINISIESKNVGSADELKLFLDDLFNRILNQDDELIIHITGHGTTTGHEFDRLIENDELISIFNDQRVSLMFFSNCYSSDLAKGLKDCEFVPITVGTEGKYGVHFGYDFEIEFYKQLLLGNNYLRAFKDSYNRKKIKIDDPYKGGGNDDFTAKFNLVEIFYTNEVVLHKWFATPKLINKLSANKEFLKKSSKDNEDIFKPIVILWSTDFNARDDFITSFYENKFHNSVKLVNLSTEYAKELSNFDNDVDRKNLQKYFTRTNGSFKFVIIVDERNENHLNPLILQAIFNKEYFTEKSNVSILGIIDEQINRSNIFSIDRFFAMDYFFSFKYKTIERLFLNSPFVKQLLDLKHFSLDSLEKFSFRFECNPTTKEIEEKRKRSSKLNIFLFDIDDKETFNYFSNFIKRNFTKNDNTIIVENRIEGLIRDTYKESLKDALSQNAPLKHLHSELLKIDSQIGSIIFLLESNNIVEEENEFFVEFFETFFNRISEQIGYDLNILRSINIVIRCSNSDVLGIKQIISKIKTKLNQDELNNLYVLPELICPSNLDNVEILERFIVHRCGIEGDDQDELRNLIDENEIHQLIRENCNPLEIIKKLIQYFGIIEKRILQIK